MQNFYQEELQDLRRLARFARRFGWSTVMSEDEIQGRAQLLSTSDGIAEHYRNLREQGRRSQRPPFLSVVTHTVVNDREKLRRLFERL